MRGTAPFALAALAVVVVGSLVLRATTGERALSPVASISNDAPRGLLVFALLLEELGRTVSARARHDASLDAMGEASRDEPPDVVVVPPPEAAQIARHEARALFARVDDGARLVVVCDDAPERNARLTALTELLGVRCAPDEEVASATPKTARAAVPGLPYATLTHRGAAHVELDDDAPFAPLVVDEEGRALVASRALGRGAVRVLVSSMIANDTIALTDNAALAQSLVDGARVVVDEAYHRPRRAEVWRGAFVARGPIAGACALLLLLACAPLGLAHRKGDAPRARAAVRALSALESARARASLYGPALARAPKKGPGQTRAAEDTSDRTTTTTRSER